MTTNQVDALLAGFKRLYTSRKCSDLTIKCGEHSFPVHRAVLCERSPVLAIECDGGFMETTTRVVNVDHDANAMACLIEYLYTADYDDTKTLSPAVVKIDNTAGVECYDSEAYADTTTCKSLISHNRNGQHSVTYEIPPNTTISPGTLILNAKVYALGDFYQIPEAKDLACAKIQWCLETGQVLTDEGLHALVQETYTSTPPHDRALRDLITNHIAATAVVLTTSEDAEKTFAITDFALNIVRAQGKLMSDGLKSRDDMIKELEERVAAVEGERRHARDQLRESDTAFDLYRQNLRGAAKALASTSKCRHCSNSINLTMDVTDTWVLPVQLRCTCRTKIN